MKTFRPLIILLVLGALLSGCTQNVRARKYGGTATVDLPAGRRLVNVTYKGDDLWLLTRPLRESEAPQTYEFIEESSWGILSGKIIINER